jgi:hypothetical protein
MFSTIIAKYVRMNQCFKSPLMPHYLYILCNDGKEQHLINPFPPAAITFTSSPGVTSFPENV